MNMIIRADASPAIGAGHIMRCLALARAWHDSGGTAVFLSRCESGNLKKRIIEEGFEYIRIKKSHPHHSDLEITIDVFNNFDADWLVLDGYHFDGAYQKSIRNEEIRLLVIDDTNHLPAYHADILLNQNIYAPGIEYNHDSDTITLLGSKYVMLRREFLSYRDWKRNIPEKSSRIIVTLGGSDQKNATRKIIEALILMDNPDLNVKVVSGPVDSNTCNIGKTLENSCFDHELLSNVKDMPGLMAWADLAVSGAGITCWESAFMGLPILTLILAENQRETACEIQKYGFGINLGRPGKLSVSMIAGAISKLYLDFNLRCEMSRNGESLIDGKGADRIVRVLMKKLEK